MASSQSPGIEPAADAIDGHREEEENSSGSEDEGHPLESTSTAPSTGQTKKKKKKKSKAVRALRALTGKSEIPQELVDRVLVRVREDGGAGSDEATAADVREALEAMKIMDVVKGKAGIGGINRKDMGEHKVCAVLCFRYCWLTTMPLVLGDTTSTSTRRGATD